MHYSLGWVPNATWCGRNRDSWAKEAPVEKRASEVTSSSHRSPGFHPRQIWHTQHWQFHACFRGSTCLIKAGEYSQKAHADDCGTDRAHSIGGSYLLWVGRVNIVEDAGITEESCRGVVKCMRSVYLLGKIIICQFLPILYLVLFKKGVVLIWKHVYNYIVR